MATKVKQTYSAGFALSITTREGGRITKVTTWNPGVSNSTNVVLDTKK